MKGSSILPKQCVLENVGLKLTLAFELQRWAWLQLNSWIWASGERHAHTHTHHSHAHSIQEDSHFYYRDNLLLSPKQNSCEPAKKLCHFFTQLTSTPALQFHLTCETDWILHVRLVSGLAILFLLHYFYHSALP